MCQLFTLIFASVYYQNIRGMRSKTHTVYKNILQHNYDIIILTETWLNSNINSCEIVDHRYHIYRRDRDVSSALASKLDGGGVLIAVKKTINSIRMKNWESNCEDLWVIVSLANGKSPKRVGIGAVYIPPPPKLVEINAYLDNTFDVMGQLDDYIIIGDFNMGFVSWSVGNDRSAGLKPEHHQNKLGHALVDFMSLSGMQQYNAIKNHQDKILDLVLSSTPCKITKPDHIISRLDPYHPQLAVYTTFKNENHLPPIPRTDYNFFKADYDKIHTGLCAIDWPKSFSDCDSVDAFVKILYEKLNDIISLFVPKRKPRKQSYPPWFRFDLIKLLKEKDKLRVRWRKFQNPRDRLEYELLRKRCDRLFNTRYREYIDNVESSLKHNPKAFWSYVKSKKSSVNQLPSVMHHGIRSANSGTGIANLFASQFSSSFSEDINDTSSSSSSCSEGSAGYMDPHSRLISNIVLKENNVLKALKNLDQVAGTQLVLI